MINPLFVQNVIIQKDTAQSFEMVQAIDQLAINVFGTGYSSLSYLKKFPINHLKIDPSFVRWLPDDSGSSSIQKSIIELGHVLDLEVLAEGIETMKQDDFLQIADCELGQGYSFSMPLTVEEFEDKWLD